MSGSAARLRMRARTLPAPRRRCARTLDRDHGCRHPASASRRSSTARSSWPTPSARRGSPRSPATTRRWPPRCAACSPTRRPEKTADFLDRPPAFTLGGEAAATAVLRRRRRRRPLPAGAAAGPRRHGRGLARRAHRRQLPSAGSRSSSRTPRGRPGSPSASRASATSWPRWSTRNIARLYDAGVDAQRPAVHGARVCRGRADRRLLPRAQARPSTPACACCCRSPTRSRSRTAGSSSTAT